ncbi:MAG: tRNA preQ1(34) S-adenosylmethionine ribosyltransferase-isomerase QueA [Patescibacteria group bacterium]
MLTSDFDYNLPKELIAQTPAEPRDSARLMVIDKNKKSLEHKHFYDLPDYLCTGDLLVWNNTKVFKARLRGTVCLDEKVIKNAPKNNSEVILNEPKVEIFLLRPMENRFVWKVLAKPGKKLQLGMKIIFAEDFSCEVMLKESDGTVLVQFEDDDMIVREKANRYGEVPTPPYIHPVKSPQSGVAAQGGQFNRVKKLGDNERLVLDYQTVYAKNEGSVAAPTAGFHFTPELIEKLKSRGVEFAEVTLHVGLGTFQPVKEEKLEQHKMHEEWVELTDKNAGLINQAKSEGRRVVAVGTTTTRALEAIADDQGFVRPFSGDINIFIYPGYKFKIIDALITNFHLPKSTLLMLVSAFVDDRKFILDCYGEAVENKYRFFSFGDAMLIK